MPTPTPTPSLSDLERDCDKAAAAYERAILRAAFDKTPENEAAETTARDALSLACVTYEIAVTRANGWQPVL
jgi:hypothetical protein